MAVGAVAAFTGSFFACRGIDVNVCKNPLPLFHTTPGIFLLAVIGFSGYARFQDGYCRIKYPEEYLPEPDPEQEEPADITQPSAPPVP